MAYPILFAPLQGFTEDAYRRAHHSLCGGVAYYFSPFVRLEHGAVRTKDLRDLNPDHNEGIPLVPQAIANGAEELAQIIDVVAAMGYRRLDLNMGCPFPLQTRHGRGAALLRQPDALSAIADLMEHHPEIAFSAKMRLGMEDTGEWKAVMDIINAMPLTQLTVHPRVARQQYKGTVDRDAFDQLLAQSAHPVVYNGDILSIDQLHELEQKYDDSLSGVMIGRSLLAQPWLAKEYTTGQQLSNRERLQLLRQLHAYMLQYYERIIPGEQQRMEKLRTLWQYAEQTLGRKPWKKIMKAGNMKNYLAAVDTALAG